MTEEGLSQFFSVVNPLFEERERRLVAGGNRATSRQGRPDDGVTSSRHVTHDDDHGHEGDRLR